MDIKKRLIKLADMFDQAGEDGIANSIDETLLKLDKKESDELLILEPKSLDDFSPEEKDIIRSFMNLFFHELEEEVGVELADKIESMIANHIG